MLDRRSMLCARNCLPRWLSKTTVRFLIGSRLNTSWYMRSLLSPDITLLRSVFAVR